MKLAIVGTKTFTDYDFFERTIEETYDIDTISEIISGGATGVDTLAEIFAKKFQIRFTVYKPDWAQYGKQAGYIINKLIVEDAHECIAFWDNVSKGTKLSIDIANKENKPCKIIKI
jgi:hypothetical protein